MKNIFITLSYILVLYIKCNNDTNKIIFFELDNKEDLIIKTIFLSLFYSKKGKTISFLFYIFLKVKSI